MGNNELNDVEQIKRVIRAYTAAAKRVDMQALGELCTPAMLRQFSFIARFGIKLTAFLMPMRLDKLAPEHIEIERQAAARAVVSYVITFGKRRHYERMVLLKVNNQWKVDGKYA